MKIEDVAIILFVAFALGSVYFYAYGLIGFHNVDSGQNIRYLNAEHDLNLHDLASDNNYYSGEELYMIGIDQMITSLRVLASFSVGMTILSLILFMQNSKTSNKETKSPKLCGKKESNITPTIK